MTVVRDLVNRISFDVNRGSRSDAEKAFKDLKSQGAGLISLAKGFGAAAVAALGAGAKFYVDQEKSDATIKFFSKTNEEAQQFLSTYNKLAGKTEIISDRDLKKAQAIFAQMNVDAKDFGKSFDVLRDINIANPDLGGLDGVMQTLKSWVQNGDLDSLRQFGAVGKDIAEQLSLSNFDATQTVKGQQNRFDLLFGLLDKNKERIKSLADDQRGTNLFAFRGLTKELSDFTLKFGKETAPAVKELAKTVRDMIKELNDSKSLWDKIGQVVGGIAYVLKNVKDVAGAILGKESVIDILKQQNIEYRRRIRKEAPGFFPIADAIGSLMFGDLPEDMDKKAKEIQQRKDEYRKLIGQDVGPFPIPKRTPERDADEQKFINSIMGSIMSGVNYGIGKSGPYPQIDPNDKQHGVFVDEKNPSMGSRFMDMLPKGEIKVSGEVRVKTDGQGNIDASKLSADISKEITGSIKESFKAVSAQHGKYVSAGGSP